ncbi:EAL domain-containing protein [Ciceribacter sp. L1K22]|uniref:putative bifunctional diguanylate cyclase/phosphodiesterase n=1 Tax=Ciceribacter sp. L1K22 TaxID=2820275 RepID=UPI001FEDE23A|nr:EAL domain-containing protein [Ciceribacter sp. L1K22]
MDNLASIGRTRFAAAIHEVQTKVLMAGQPSTLAFNTLIVVSVTLLTIAVGDGFYAILGWAAAVLTTIAFRAALQVGLRKRQLPAMAPQFCLRAIGVGALCSGLAWAALPFVIADFEGTGADAYVYLIMMGISGGAVIRGIGCAYPSLAFAVPVQLAILVSLLRTGGTVDLVLAANVVAFTVILVRSSIDAERVFVGNELGKLEATSLAGSLSRANRDIQQSNSQLEVVASRDSLTGLPNRTRFAETLAHKIDVEREPACLLLLDVDRFKTINDTLGHGAGDAVLKEVARRLLAAAGETGLIARLGGDEFAILVTGEDAVSRAAALADRILDVSRQPVALAGTALSIGLSIGLAGFPDHAASAGELLACADMALYAAKERGRRRVQEFEPTMKSRADRQRLIEQDLESAIDQSRLEVWFQPQVRLDTGEITGFEALLRWFHPQFGVISPPEVVEAAQALHLAERLTEFVADRACRLLSRLAGLGLPAATVALNVSPNEFALYSVADMLERVTNAHAIDTRLLEIEITEEAILDADGAGEQLKRLETAGYKLAVDDFGMGHSSLAYLVSLKVDRLKIDRSFVTGVSETRANQELITALVGLGQALSIEIVVEGVESPEDAATLKDLGCRIAQGYHFARPMPVEALDAWLDVRRDRPGKRKARHLSVA